MKKASYRHVLLAYVVLNCATAGAQCYIDPYTGLRTCPIQNYGWQPKSGSATSRPTYELTDVRSSAHCRITVGDGSTGSGTLIDCDESTGTVLTCSHLFDSATSNIVVSFPSGKRFAALLLERDPPNDLAALSIRRPDAAPLVVGEEEPAGTLSACGYGPSGQFRRVSGGVVGHATATGAAYPSLVIGCAVRPGDSGGGVLDAAGQLVGVVWGERDGQTYVTCGRPVREFLRRVLGSESGVESRKPETRDPQSSALGPQIDWSVWSKEIESRIEALDDRKQDKGDYLQPGDLNGYLTREEFPDPSVLATRNDVMNVTTETTSRIESLRAHLHTRIEERLGHVLPALEQRIAESQPGLFAGLSLGKLIVGAMGLSGPLAAAVLVAAGLTGRRVRSRVEGHASRDRKIQALDPRPSTLDQRPIAVDSPPPPQRSVPETHYVPYEKDSFARAHQWASEQVARKYPGATELLQAQDSLIKQHLAAS